jgi:hypothetical protein
MTAFKTVSLEEIRQRVARLKTQRAAINELEINDHDDERVLEYSKLVAHIEGQISAIDYLLAPGDISKTVQFTMSGYSDDNICLDGDIHDEVGGYGDDPKKFVCSDGTKGDIVYGKGGVWRINIIPVPGTVVTMVKGISEEEDPDSDYSDKATITGRIEWIMFDGGSILRPKEGRCKS